MASPRSASWPVHLPRALTYPRTSVFYNLEVSATRYPDKPLLHYYGSTLTYGRALREAEALAGYLQQRCAVGRGDRVLLFMQNAPQFIIAYYAILRADAVVVPVNPMNLTEELRHYVEDSGARVAIAGQELFAQLQPLLGNSGLAHAVVAAYGDYVHQPTDLPLPPVVAAAREALHTPGAVSWHDAIAAALAPAAHRAGPEDLCVMPYTSGTTGRPKGCMHTHATVMSTLVISATWRGDGHKESVSLCTLPCFHVTGMQSGMNAPIFAASTVVLMTRWDRDTAARLIARHRVEGWTNITTMAVDFLSNPDLGRHDLSSLRAIGGGGAAMPAAIAERLRDQLGLDYMEGYGLTETMGPTHINPPQGPRRQCLGIAVCDTDARVVDPGTLAALGAGEVGEIVSSGPQIFQGYWNNPQASAECFFEHDGRRFFRTGDLGYRDEDGYFYIVDRLKRMINASGLKVWPAEVEAILYGHPAIQEACIIASKDPYRGESVKAVVVLKAGQQLSETDLLTWSRAHMAAYKAPRSVQFVDSLPKSATGKILWRVLQEQEMGTAQTRS